MQLLLFTLDSRKINGDLFLQLLMSRLMKPTQKSQHGHSWIAAGQV